MNSGDESFHENDFYGETYHDNEDDEYEQLSNESEMDEQHTQKVNGQIENLQQKVEELTHELLIERRKHEELLYRKQADDTIYLEQITASQHYIEDLKAKINERMNNIEILPDDFSNDFKAFCQRLSLRYDNNEGHHDHSQPITIHSFNSLLNKVIQLIESSSMKGGVGVTTQLSTRSSGISTTSASNQLSQPLQQEFYKLCGKLSISLTDLYPYSNDQGLNDEKCIQILNKIGKLNHDQNIKIKSLESEIKMSINASEDIRALKTKLIQLVERLRIEKEHKIKAENDSNQIKRKLELISEHVEKLMAHLKHEANAKLRLADQLRTSEREFNQVKETCEAIQRKSTAKDRLIIELREGSKILEDQLRLMDEKYLELRSKLDWTREIGAERLRKAEKKAADLRVKYAMSTNSIKMLDTIALPDIANNRSYNIQDHSILPDKYSTISMHSYGSRKTMRAPLSRGGRNIKNNSMQLHDINKPMTTSGLLEEPSMEHVLEKLRIQENRKKEWTEDKVRKLVQLK